MFTFLWKDPWQTVAFSPFVFNTVCHLGGTWRELQFTLCKVCLFSYTEHKAAVRRGIVGLNSRITFAKVHEDKHLPHISTSYSRDAGVQEPNDVLMTIEIPLETQTTKNRKSMNELKLTRHHKNILSEYCMASTLMFQSLGLLSFLMFLTVSCAH